MNNIAQQSFNRIAGRTSQLWLGLVAVTILFAPGCTVFHPLRGVPASYLPNEFEGPSKAGKNTINLGLLTRTQPSQHRVAAGDVLSIYVPRVLGRLSTEIRDVGIEPPINTPNTEDDPPTLGYPITVRDDHTISLPQLPPLNVHGMTIQEVENAIRHAYTVEHKIIQPEEAMVLVSLQRARVHRVLVVRQEVSNDLSGGATGAGTLNMGASKRGTARTVTLKAYENDVMHALALAEGVGGLPGLDAKNTIYIIRRRQNQQASYPQPSMQQPNISYPPAYESQPVYGAPQAPIMQMNYETTSSTNSNVMRDAHVVQTAHSMQSSQGNSSQRNPSPIGDYRGVQHDSVNQPVQQAAVQAVQGHSMASPYASARRGNVQTMSGHSMSMPVNTPVPQLNMPPVADQGIYAPQGMHAPAMPAYPNQPQMMPPQSVMPNQEPQWGSMLSSFDPTIESPNVVKIPVRLSQGEMPTFTEQDITLEDGDIVFIESRETEVFYTGGLLGGGQYTLPRDYDLHVLEALAIAEGRNAGGGTELRTIGGISALNQDVATSASRLVMLRKLPNGQRISIEVDIQKAMRYQQEDILVQPGDMLILSYTFPEAVAAFTQRFLLEGALIGIATSTFTGGGGGG